MLDERGFLAETNATNLFLVRDGVLCTPLRPRLLARHHQRLHLEPSAPLGIDVREGDFSLTELYNADEAFTTGTMGGWPTLLKWTDQTIGTDQAHLPGR